MIVISDKKTCCGCGGCANVCPVNAVSMVEDAEGFLYPNIDSDKCVDCGLCEKVCPILCSKADDEPKTPPAYMAWALDDDIRVQSSSGGVFTVLAEDTLARGGIVFGAAFVGRKLKHISVESVSELAALRGSKYLQSDVGDSFSQVKQLLDSGRQVLFSGTPCQVEGLRAFLRKDYNNLILVDFICHGVPSPKVWDLYVSSHEKRVGAKAEAVSFRDKRLSWQKFSVKIVFANGEMYEKSLDKDSYMRAFLANLDLRPSCYSCSFKKKNRVSDITLADFWGVDGLYPNEDHRKGVSLVFVHSAKGGSMLHDNQKRLYISPTDFNKAVSNNPSMIESVSVPKARERFMDIYSGVGVENAVKELLKVSPVKKAYKKAMARLYRFTGALRRLLLKG